MKLKVRPDDFEVEELMRLTLRPRGRFAIYQLEKRLWNTLDALDLAARKYGLRNIRRGGLKDKYSHSTQYVSASGSGPSRIEEKNLKLRRIGFSDEPVSLDRMIGNRFRIVLRDVKPDELERIRTNLPGVREHGFPNYYDEQRFGSSRHGAGFIAHKLILGHFNGALKLYLATPSAFDDRRTREAKSYLQEHWGEWDNCQRHALPESARVIHYLAQYPKDFEGAIQEIRRDLLELFVVSYQSWLWNESLAQLIMSFGVPTRSVSYSEGELLFYTGLNPTAREFFNRHELPAASPQAEFTSERIERAVNAVLLREGLTLREMKLKLRIKGIFFKPFIRSGIVHPNRLHVSLPQPDELYPGRQQLELKFVLPPGSYATILVKRLTI
jgi:tRNA pseudouridine13 synthase